MPEVQRMGQGHQDESLPKMRSPIRGRSPRKSHNKSESQPQNRRGEVEKPAKAGATMTIEHVKAVAETVKTLGGFDRVNQLLATVKEVGGPRRFKELVDVMAMTQPTETKE